MDDDMEVIEEIKPPEKEPTNPMDIWGGTSCIFCKCNLVESLSDPKLLTCLHAACMNCVHEKSSNDNLTCDGCTQVCQLTEIIDHQFVIELKRGTNNNNESDKKNVTCACDDEAQVSSYCDDCRDWLCDECVSAHQRVRFTKDHVIKKKEDLEIADKDGQILSGQSRYLQCPSHKQELLKLYCESCEKLTCRDCQLVEHKDHKYQFLSAISDQYKLFLTTLLTKIKEKSSYIDSAQHLVTKRQSEILEREDEVTKEIKMFAVQIITLINQRGKQLLQELHDTCEKKKEQLVAKNEELVNLSLKLEHCLKFADSAVKESSDSALVYSKKLITNQLRHVLHKRCEVPNPQHIVDIRFMYDNKYLPEYINKVGQIVVDQQANSRTTNSRNSSLPNQATSSYQQPKPPFTYSRQSHIPNQSTSPQQRPSPPIGQVNYNSRPQMSQNANQVVNSGRAIPAQGYQQMNKPYTPRTPQNMDPTKVRQQMMNYTPIRPRMQHAQRAQPQQQQQQQQQNMPVQQSPTQRLQNSFQQHHDSGVRILNVQSLQSRNNRQQNSPQINKVNTTTPKVISVTSMSTNNQQQVRPNSNISLSMTNTQRLSHFPSQANNHSQDQSRVPPPRLPNSSINRMPSPVKVLELGRSNSDHAYHPADASKMAIQSNSRSVGQVGGGSQMDELGWLKQYTSQKPSYAPRMQTSTRMPPPMPQSATSMMNYPAAPQNRPANTFMPPPPPTTVENKLSKPPAPISSSPAAEEPVDDKAAVRAAIAKIKQEMPEKVNSSSCSSNQAQTMTVSSLSTQPTFTSSQIEKKVFETQKNAEGQCAFANKITSEPRDQKPTIGPNGAVVEKTAAPSSAPLIRDALSKPTVSQSTVCPGFPSAIPDIPAIKIKTERMAPESHPAVTSSASNTVSTICSSSTNSSVSSKPSFPMSSASTSSQKMQNLSGNPQLQSKPVHQPNLNVNSVPSNFNSSPMLPSVRPAYFQSPPAQINANNPRVMTPPSPAYSPHNRFGHPMVQQNVQSASDVGHSVPLKIDNMAMHHNLPTPPGPTYSPQSQYLGSPMHAKLPTPPGPTFSPHSTLTNYPVPPPNVNTGQMRSLSSAQSIVNNLPNVQPSPYSSPMTNIHSNSQKQHLTSFDGPPPLQTNGPPLLQNNAPPNITMTRNSFISSNNQLNYHTLSYTQSPRSSYMDKGVNPGHAQTYPNVPPPRYNSVPYQHPQNHDSMRYGTTWTVPPTTQQSNKDMSLFSQLDGQNVVADHMLMSTYSSQNQVIHDGNTTIHANAKCPPDSLDAELDSTYTMLEPLRRKMDPLESSGSIESVINVLQSICSEVNESLDNSTISSIDPMQNMATQSSLVHDSNIMKKVIQNSESAKEIISPSKNPQKVIEEPPQKRDLRHLVPKYMQRRQISVALFNVSSKILPEFVLSTKSRLINKQTRREMRRRERILRRKEKLQKVKRKRSSKSVAKEDSDNSDAEDAELTKKKKIGKYDQDPDWEGPDDDYAEYLKRPKRSSSTVPAKEKSYRRIRTIHQELDKMIFSAIQEIHDKGTAITKEVIVNKAKQLSEDLGIEKFVCDDNWFENFGQNNEVKNMLREGRDMKATNAASEKVFSYITVEVCPTSSSSDIKSSVSFIPVESVSVTIAEQDKCYICKNPGQNVGDAPAESSEGASEIPELTHDELHKIMNVKCLIEDQNETTMDKNMLELEDKGSLSEVIEDNSKFVIEKALEDNSKSVTEETLQDSSKSVAEETLQDSSKSVAEETPEDNSKSVTEETLQDSSKSVAEETLQDNSKSVTEETPEDNSKSVTEETSEDNSKSVTEETSEDNSKSVAEETMDIASS